MSRYAPENPQLNFCYELKDKEVMKNIFHTAYKWYLASETYNRYPEDQESTKMDYELIIDQLDEWDGEDVQQVHYILSTNSFVDNLWNVIPFEFDIVDSDCCPMITPIFNDSSFSSLSRSLHFGDSIAEIIKEKEVSMDDPKLSNFIRFIEEANLLHIKNEFDWKFVHSDWDR